MRHGDHTNPARVGRPHLARLRRLAVSAAALPPRVLAAELGWRTFRTGCRACARDRTVGARPPIPENWRPFVLGAVGARPKVGPSPLELEECLREADAALEGRFTVLGYGTVTVDKKPHGWHQDPVHGFTWPDRHHRLLGPVPGRADIKVPWEVGRLQWLTALARAHAYTGDSRYRDGAVELLRSWAAANPVGAGPNWTNAMEAGIRAANLVWAAEILGDPRFTSLAGGMLRDHGWFIVANLEYSPRLTSNHYLADLVGLVHAGGALRHSPAGLLWLRIGGWQLQQEIVKQFHEDGSNFEASTGYHRLSTELALVGLLALRRLRMPVRPEVRNRLLAAVEALSALTKPDGLLPALGDDDSGLVIGLQSGRDPRDASPIVAAAAAALEETEPSGETVGPELAQWCGAPTRRTGTRPHAASFASAGWYVLSAGPYWCLAECGGVGQLGNGGHGHNDTLSFVLCVDGHEIVTDPGTGVYTPDPRLRNLLRATRSHSTVEVDGQEQNRFDSALLFTMRSDDRARVVDHHEDGSGRQVVEAIHEGYRRLDDPVVHRRRFTLDPQGLTISDHFGCRAPHTLAVSFPLSPGVRAEQRDGETLLMAAGTVVVLSQTVGPRLAFALEEMPWSPAYGRVVTAPVLRATLRAEGPVSWELRFRAADGART